MEVRLKCVHLHANVYMTNIYNMTVIIKCINTDTQVRGFDKKTLLSSLWHFHWHLHQWAFVLFFCTIAPDNFLQSHHTSKQVKLSVLMMNLIWTLQNYLYLKYANITFYSHFHKSCTVVKLCGSEQEKE